MLVVLTEINFILQPLETKKANVYVNGIANTEYI